jgi:quercetin dioxygenase-like cupin family protein
LIFLEAPAKPRDSPQEHIGYNSDIRDKIRIISCGRVHRRECWTVSGMNYPSQNILRQIILFTIPLLLLTACATVPTTQPTAIPTPTSASSSALNENSLLAALTANEVGVTVSGESNADKSLQKFETANIPVGDRITLDKTGRGVMRFGDRHEIDIFGDTEIQLADAQLEPGGSTFLRLKQIQGHTHTQLNPQAIARVTLETADSTMTTLEQGTEFAVCFAPGNVTCIVVLEGALEVTSQGAKQIYKKGEFTFYEPGQQPQPPLCIHQDGFKNWLQRKRSPADTEPLSQLVAGWPQEPCAPGGQATEAPPPPTAVDVTPLPPTEAPPPTEATQPTMPPTATPLPTPYVRINNITVDQDNRYIVEYETFGYSEQLPGMHVHFFFNTVPPEQAGVPGSGPWILYGGPRPFTQYTVYDRPAQATQMCALVANSDHSVQLNTGNCVDLP